MIPALEAVIAFCTEERARLLAAPWSRTESRELELIDAVDEAVTALLAHRALVAARRPVETVAP